jgi:hypothetical protein
MKTETITWHELPADGLPDAETTVQMEILQDDGTTETWPGWWCGERWIDAGSGTPVAFLVGEVVAWADVPAGSRAC